MVKNLNLLKHPHLLVKLRAQQLKPQAVLLLQAAHLQVDMVKNLNLLKHPHLLVRLQARQLKLQALLLLLPAAHLLQKLQKQPTAIKLSFHTLFL